jgi:hypothetical protein
MMVNTKTPMAIIKEIIIMRSMLLKRALRKKAFSSKDISLIGLFKSDPI